MAVAVAKAAAINKALKEKELNQAPKPKEKPKVRFYNGPTTGWRAYQPLADKIYTTPSVEYFVAFLIVANFFISITEKWIDPMASHMNPANRKYAGTWDRIGLMFNILFLIELTCNMYAYWLWDFWLVTPDGVKWGINGWNCFDFIVVVVGWLIQVKFPLPGPFKLMRLLRAFRVFRLFKRVKSLNKIIVSLGRAVPGMINAMMIMLIVMSIYAILGVEFFSHSFTPRIYEEYSTVSGGVGYTDDEWILQKSDSENYVRNPEKYECPDQLLDNETTTCYTTSRGNGFGEEYFGNFGRSLYTLFQVLTGDSWSEAIARPMFEAEPIVTTLYFVSYVVFIAIVLVNVVVAVLLEKMVDDGEEGEEEEEDGTYNHKHHQWSNNNDTKATIGELWDLKQDIRAKHMVMQAQLDALTANIELLCAKQGVEANKPESFLKPPNEEDNGYFDSEGNRLVEEDRKTGEMVEKVRAWPPLQPQKEDEEEGLEVGAAKDSGSKIAPVVAGNDIAVVEISSEES